ncbi:hypothetical protein CTM_13643 [Clostridium tetanomorphum DSM 665]|nr:hypothetical protein CTM_13643 [Clostridium tetanomorphum DSM 665]
MFIESIPYIYIFFTIMLKTTNTGIPTKAPRIPNSITLIITIKITATPPKTINVTKIEMNISIVKIIITLLFIFVLLNFLIIGLRT